MFNFEKKYLYSQNKMFDDFQNIIESFALNNKNM